MNRLLLFLFASLACCTLLYSCEKESEQKEEQEEPKLPDPPISISFRASNWGSGQVLQIRNTSGTAYLSCRLTVQNTTQGTVKRHYFSIKPAELSEIGLWEMNWSFMTGEKIWIETEGFATVSYKVP